MAKKAQKKGFSLQGFDVNHYKQTESYVQAIDTLYNRAVAEFAQLAGKININPDKPFSFADYPATKNAAQTIINKLASNMQTVIVKGSREQWLYACKKNDQFLASILNTTKVPKKTLAKYQDQNLEALKTFQGRKVNGMGLSDRIWNYTGQMKTQMELGIDIAVGEGKSANALSKDLRQYLVDPDKLFHRVRNKHGNLVLSKNAKAFHPGQGKYRSSYKNAMRLTRSEINMSYRESDQIRWSKLDFIVGYEVKLSNNHTLNGKPFKDICDELEGKYPKTFTFKGWHPQCRCHVVPIMQDRDEFNTDELNELKAAFNGTEYKKFESRNRVADVPDNFKDWIATNADRAEGWKSQPYWIRDNFQGGRIDGGLKFATTPSKAPTPAPKPEPIIKPADVVKPVIKFTEVKTADDVIKVTTEADTNGTWFARGFKELTVTRRSGVNGHTDLHGRIALTQTRYERTISGIAKIKRGEDITFEEADSLSTYWHEITHNSNKIGNSYMSELKTRYMELANEFVARKTLPEFYTALGAKETPHPELMNNRKSTGYNDMVVNYDKAIELFGLDKAAVLVSVRKHLVNDHYRDQFDGLVDALKSQGIKRYDGKVLSINEVRDVVRCCLSSESYFLASLKYKGLIQ
ncbi:hypothetical protein JZU61_04375 [bacterium]|nr:hypothetical protein [bacterium]